MKAMKAGENLEAGDIVGWNEKDNKIYKLKPISPTDLGIQNIVRRCMILNLGESFVVRRRMGGEQEITILEGIQNTDDLTKERDEWKRKYEILQDEVNHIIQKIKDLWGKQ